MLRFLARFLAVVAAIAFVMTAVLAVVLHPVGTKMLDPQTYKEVVREEKVAERVPELLADTIATSVEAAKAAKAADQNYHKTGDVLGFLTNFPREDMQELLQAVLPTDYVGAQLEGAIDQAFAYLNTDAAAPSIRFSVVDLKQRLAGGVLEDAYVKMLRRLPPCEGDPGALPVTCCPPEERIGEVRNQFRKKVASSVQDLPDSFDVFAQQPSAETQRVFTMLSEFRNRVQKFALVARWAWLVPAMLLLAIAVFGVRSLRGLLLWWGVPGVLAGMGAMLFAFPGAVAALGEAFFNLVVAPQLPAGSPVLAFEFVFGLISNVAQVMFGSVLKTSLLLLGGGVAAIALSFFFKPKPATPQPMRPV